MAKDEHYSDEETARRRDEVIKRMGNTPPKPHSEMKIGKRKAKASAPSKKMEGARQNNRAPKLTDY